MSANAWLIWFALQTLVLLGVLGIAMLGVTGQLTRTHHRVHRPAPGPTQRRHHLHLHLPIRHRPAH